LCIFPTPFRLVKRHGRLGPVLRLSVLHQLPELGVFLLLAKDAQNVAKDRMALAAARLAKILNDGSFWRLPVILLLALLLWRAV